MKKEQLLQNIEITDISTEGKGIGRTNNIVVFAHFAVPGDMVDVQIAKKKSNYIEGKVIHYHKFSEKRTEPVCKHFGICGGCKWQNMQYESQLFYKEKFVKDALQRIGKTEETKILPILPSKNIFFYRNKLEFTFSNKRWLTDEEIKVLPNGETPLPNGEGQVRKDSRNSSPIYRRGSPADSFGGAGLGGALGFHLPKHFDKILDLEECHLQKEPSNAIRLEIKKFALENGISFFDIRKQNGLLRNLIIRNTSIGQFASANSSSGEWMVIVVFFYDDKPAREKLLNHILKTFPHITSLQYIVNPKKNDSISDLESRTFFGKNFIEEEMPVPLQSGLKFRISAKSFFQTNPEQAEQLCRIIEEFSELTGNDTVYDLYTGAGTIANFLARSAKKVIGIEYIREAIEDAKVNSQINKISNTEFFTGDIKEVLNEEFVSVHGKPNVIITDPPRAGMHEGAVKKILNLSPQKIIYVSCNPATQARDIALMSGYSVTKVQPVDMFPHTAHVESVAKLVKK